MVDMYVRLDTSHGEDGRHLPKVNPPLYGLELEDVTGETAGVADPKESVRERMDPDANVEEKLLTTDAETAGGMTEKPIPTGSQKLANEVADGTADERSLGETTVLGDAKRGRAEGASDVDKAAADATSSPSIPSSTGKGKGGDTVTGTFKVDKDDDDTVPADAVLSKTALRGMDKSALVAYAEKRNIDCTDASKEEIIAALYGE